MSIRVVINSTASFSNGEPPQQVTFIPCTIVQGKSASSTGLILLETSGTKELLCHESDVIEARTQIQIVDWKKPLFMPALPLNFVPGVAPCAMCCSHRIQRKEKIEVVPE